MDPAVVHFSTVFMAFFAIMNPIANAPIFVGLTGGLPAAARRAVAARAVVLAFVIVGVFAVGGGLIFSLFGITLAAFRVTGGVLIGVVGYHMLQGRSSPIHSPGRDVAPSPDALLDVAVSPLALPILAGPGTIATAMSFSAHAGMPALLWTLGAFAGICALTYAAFLGGERLTRLLGEHVIGVVTRLMGLILAVIGVQMLIAGIRGAVAGE